MDFKSKIDFKLGFFIWIGIIAGIVMAVSANLWIPRFFPGLKFLLIVSNIISIPVIIFMVWAWFGTRYTITDESLAVKYGCFLFHISIDEIIEISKLISTNLSPALSSDRLNVRTTNYSILISPRDAELFVANLLKINKSIVVID
jgi:hypothetical protein